MPSAKVKFNSVGDRCSKNERQLRRMPECGIFFIQDKPFEPDNHHFEPIPDDPSMPPLPSFRVNKLTRKLEKHEFPTPKFPDKKHIDYDDKLIKFGEIWDGIDLPQDQPYNNLRRLHESFGENQRDNYQRIKTNANLQTGAELDDYMHITRNVSSFSTIGSDSGAGIQDDGAGVGFGLRRRNVPIPLGSQEIIDFAPLDHEFKKRIAPRVARTLSPDDALTLGRKTVNQIRITDPIFQEHKVMVEVEKILTFGRRTLTTKQVDVIVKKMEAFSIDKSTVEEILIQNNKFNPEIEALPASQRQFAERLNSANNEIIDSNFRPTNPSVTDDDLNLIREDTPLTDRTQSSGLRQRTKFKKIIDKNIANLPEEIRSTFSKTSKLSSEVINKITKQSDDLMQNISASKTRIFGQKYSSQNTRDLELGMPANTRDLINVDIDGFQDILPTPNEGYARPPPRLKINTKITSSAIGGIGAGSGMLAGIGMSKFLASKGIDGYGNAAISGFTGGTVGTVASQAAEQALIKTGVRTGIRLSGQTLLKAALKGGGIGAVFSVGLMPVDNLINTTLVSHGLNHAESNIISGGITGGIGLGATVLVSALILGPETMGMSLVVGALAFLASELYAWFQGVTADHQDRIDAINKQNTRHEYTENRSVLLGKYLAMNDYNFDKALNMYKQLNPENDLGESSSDWETFRDQMSSIFTENPVINSERKTPDEIFMEQTDKIINPMIKDFNKHWALSGKGHYDRYLNEIYALRDKHIQAYNDNKPDAAKANSLMSQYINNKLLNDSSVCTNKERCSGIVNAKELTADEIEFMDTYSKETWRDGAELQFSINKAAMFATRKQVSDAQTYLKDQWDTNKLAPDQLDEKWIKMAEIDPTFHDKFYDAIEENAQNIIIHQYFNKQVKINQLPSNLVRVANLDLKFNDLIHNIYADTEQLASQLNITIPQLIELQNTDETNQTEKYDTIVFNNSKENPDYVEQALDIYHANTLVKSKEFYDYDEFRLDTDPTAINTWKPNDSQILQAHQSGLTLQQYQNYMQELSKGADGDFSKIPKLSKEIVRATGIVDFSHFTEEVAMAGYNPNAYTYDPDTLAINRLNWIDNDQNINNMHTDKFMPESFSKSQTDYKNYILNINLKNKANVNDYNNNLMRTLRAQHKNDNSIDVNAEYNNHAMSYDFISSNKQPVSVESKDVYVVPTSSKPVTAVTAVTAP